MIGIKKRDYNMIGDITLLLFDMYVKKPKRNKYSVKQMFRDYREGINLMGIGDYFLLKNFDSDDFHLQEALSVLQDEMESHKDAIDDELNMNNELVVICMMLSDNEKVIAFAARPWYGDRSGKWQYILGDIDGYAM